MQISGNASGVGDSTGELCDSTGMGPTLERPTQTLGNSWRREAKGENGRAGDG